MIQVNFSHESNALQNELSDLEHQLRRTLEAIWRTQRRSCYIVETPAQFGYETKVVKTKKSVRRQQ